MGVRIDLMCGEHPDYNGDKKPPKYSDGSGPCIRCVMLRSAVVNHSINRIDWPCFDVQVSAGRDDE